MTERATIEQMAAELAYSLGVSMWIRDGRIWQNGPGQEIRPPPGATPTPLGVPEVKGGAAPETA